MSGKTLSLALGGRARPAMLNSFQPNERHHP